MNNTETQIIEKLTLEDVSRINVHTTLSSLRRALALKSHFIQPESADVPRLYYVTDDNSIHALASDLTRFLLKKSFQEE
jgi:DNA-binding SARP family transcriptional activator